MNADPVKLGIVGLGRWAKVLTRAAVKSDKLKIVSAYSRSEDKRQTFQQEFGIKAVSSFPPLKSAGPCSVAALRLTS